MAKLPERQIVQIEKLKPAAYNPRKDLKRGDPEYDHLAESMEAFGYIEPIVWNKRSGNVVGGHQRLKVLIERGETEAEVVVVDYDETTEQAANLALNKIRGDWDFPKLANLLTDLDTGAFDLELTGFSEGELKNIMGWTPEIIGSQEETDGQGFASPWSQVKASDNIKVTIGPIETRLTGELYNQLSNALQTAYEVAGAPIHETLASIIAEGLNALEHP